MIRLYHTIIIAAIALICCSATAEAQNPQNDDSDRRRMLEEVRNYKHQFITRELDLTKEQQSEFFPVYDEMEDRLTRLNAETRDLEHRVSSDAQASDVEVEAAARALFGLKRAEGDIENEYFDKFKQILNPKQLLGLKNTERKFTQQLMMHHRRLRGDGRHKQ